MKRNVVMLTILILMLSATQTAEAQTPDSTQTLRWAPFAASVGAGAGHVFRPRSVEKYNISFPAYQSTSASLLFSANRSTLIDALYGKPYFGVGAYKPYYHMQELLGDPYSLYLIYGLSILQLSHDLSLSTEAKLGVSVGWNPYNSTTNQANRIIGAKNNYHASIDFFFKYRINLYLQARFGATYAHFSDGAYRLPNAGLNTVGGFTDLLVSFNERPKVGKSYLSVTKAKPHIEYDLGITCSSRQILGQVENTSSTVILNHSFKAMDLYLYAMYMGSHYLRIGTGLHLVYDESSNVTATRTLNESAGEFVNSYEPSASRERFAAGIFGKAELPMGYINALAAIGYIFTPDSSNSFIRTNLGLKSYVYKGINATFGIQFTPQNEANCVFFGLGYTFGYHSLFR